MSHGRVIAKNAVWLLAATAAQKLIAFLTFTVIARLTGAEVTGQFFYAVSITSVFVVLTDLGMTPVVIREMAQDELRGRAALARAVVAKALLIPLAIASSLGYALIVHASTTLFLAVALACFVMSADAVSLLWYGAIRGKRQLRHEALGMFFGQMISASVSIAAAVWHAGPIGLVFGLLCGSAWNVGWSIWQAHALGITLAHQDRWLFRELAIKSFPFALAGGFVKIYSYVDTLLLRQFFSDSVVGYYAVAYKLTYAFQFLPLAFVAALYPGMSAAHASPERDALRHLFMESLRLMMIVSVPIVALLSGFAFTIIPLIYGRAFLASVAPLTLLPWVLIPIFVDFPIGSLLNATHRAGKKTTAMGITCAINVTANVILVPRYGPLGAAIAGVVSFWTLLAVGTFFVRRDLPSVGWMTWLVARGSGVALVAWIVIRFWLSSFSLPIALALATGLLFVLLVVSGLVTRPDLMIIKRLLRRESTI